ncbi:hypothetical protein MetexDRAFT_5057 [Methylorubrum extorquens DSM 13060]|uniref:Uncharacterized protein n=2 Tax=Methylorubrum extorquens TaxID=408 RepID=H1KQZ4_METEX|nr:hypothetical protein MetexDRAFT_5057 [Methylorubrum extorquens DSM 13060]
MSDPTNANASPNVQPCPSPTAMASDPVDGRENASAGGEHKSSLTPKVTHSTDGVSADGSTASASASPTTREDDPSSTSADGNDPFGMPGMAREPRSTGERDDLASIDGDEPVADCLNRELQQCMRLGSIADEVEHDVRQQHGRVKQSLDEAMDEVHEAIKAVFSVALLLSDLSSEAVGEFIAGLKIYDKSGKYKKLPWRNEYAENPALALCRVAFPRTSDSERSKRAKTILYGLGKFTKAAEFDEWHRGEHSYGDGKKGRGKAAAYQEAAEALASPLAEAEQQRLVDSEGQLLLSREPIFRVRIDLGPISPGWLTGGSMHVTSEGELSLYGPLTRDPKRVAPALARSLKDTSVPLETHPLFPLLQSISLAQQLLLAKYVQKKHAVVPTQPRIMLLRRSGGAFPVLDVRFGYQKARPNLSVQLPDVLPTLPAGETFFLDVQAQTALLSAAEKGEEVSFEAPTSAGQPFTFKYRDGHTAKAAVLVHDTALTHPVHVLTSLHGGGWPISFSFSTAEAAEFQERYKFVERAYGRNLKKRLLQRPLVWDVRWDGSSEQIILDISVGAQVSLGITVGRAARCPADIDDQSFGASEINKFSRLLTKLNFEEVSATLHNRLLVFSGSWLSVDFEFEIPALYKYGYDVHSATLEHSSCEWWNACPALTRADPTRTPELYLLRDVISSIEAA